MTDEKLDTTSIRKWAGMIADKDAETARTGKRQLWEAVRHVGRPGNEQEQQAVLQELLKLTGKDQPVAVRREVIWAISELGGNDAVDAIAVLLADIELREDARMVLQRIPGKKSLEALKTGLSAAPADFKPNVAESLRACGVQVPDVPDDKLKPCRETKVKPVGRA
jgi:hypothetical protein